MSLPPYEHANDGPLTLISRRQADTTKNPRVVSYPGSISDIGYTSKAEGP